MPHTLCLLVNRRLPAESTAPLELDRPMPPFISICARLRIPSAPVARSPALPTMPFLDESFDAAADPAELS